MAAALRSRVAGSLSHTAKPLVDEAIDQETFHHHHGLLYAFVPSRAAFVVPDLELRGRVIRRHRESIGSRWRKLNPGQQAMLVLVYLRKGETYLELTAGFGVGTATAWL